MPGAQLLFHFALHTASTLQPHSRMLAATAQDMVSEQLVTAADLGEMCPADFLARAEVVKGVVQRPDVLSAWSVRYCDVKAVENPLWPAVQSGQIITAQYAAACRRTIQAIGEPSMLAGLMAARTAGSSNSGSGSSNGNDSIDSGSSGGCGIDNGSGSDGVASHSESQARALLDELYDRSEQRMAACGALPMVQDFMYCWLERKGDSKEHTYG